jgi:hypothetical protein
MTADDRALMEVIQAGVLLIVAGLVLRAVFAGFMHLCKTHPVVANWGVMVTGLALMAGGLVILTGARGLVGVEDLPTMMYGAGLLVPGGLWYVVGCSELVGPRKDGT